MSSYGLIQSYVGLQITVSVMLNLFHHIYNNSDFTISDSFVLHFCELNDVTGQLVSSAVDHCNISERLGGAP
jgi:hypothetical protein